MLAALTGGAPLSLVAPMRERSIIMVGALMGMLILRAAVGPWRLAECGVLTAGVILPPSSRRRGVRQEVALVADLPTRSSTSAFAARPLVVALTATHVIQIPFDRRLAVAILRVGALSRLERKRDRHSAR